MHNSNRIADMQYSDEKRQLLKHTFKYLNRVMLLMWRLGLGGFINIAPRYLGRIMVLVHTGRKSGRTRYTPVNFVAMDGDIYCMAGFGQQSQWYKNIQTHPEVEIWLPDGWWTGQAEEVTDRSDRARILRAILNNTGFAAPLFEGIHPRQLADADFERLIEDHDYRLLLIRRNAAMTGPNGPGELAWIWPVLVLALLIIQRKSR